MTLSLESAEALMRVYDVEFKKNLIFISLPIPVPLHLSPSFSPSPSVPLSLCPLPHAPLSPLPPSLHSSSSAILCSVVSLYAHYFL